MSIKLESWECVAHFANLYGPPKQSLRGRNEDGLMIRTSPIKNINGPFITTESGTVYQLGTPSQSFVDFCNQNGYHVPTPEEPIKALSHDCSKH